MKYYLIAGEASGDLHASHLMKALKEEDREAEFRFFGGDLMAAQGGTLVKHYRELAYMGFVPVLLHLPTIFRNMAFCKRDIVEWQPDVTILIDYPGFNLNIAKFLGKRNRKGNQARIPVFYYISPKIWAWKEYRIRNIKRDVDELFSILPFEVEFFEQKHHFPIHYVGNPTADEVRLFRQENPSPQRQDIIALLAGSRRQEIKDNLPAMLRVAEGFDGYRLVVAGAPGIEPEYYDTFLQGHRAEVVHDQTYCLLSQATAALVTSGTATLETALLGVPQVVCYKTPVPRLIRFAFNHVIKCKYISLVNLIAGREVVKELFADRFTESNIRQELQAVLPEGKGREAMLNGYKEVEKALGDTSAPANAARIMNGLLRGAPL